VDAREDQNVGGTLFAMRHFDAALPGFETVPEFGDIADFERLPIRLSEVRQLLITRACPSSAPRIQCSRDRFLERLALGLGKRIAHRAPSGDVKRQPLMERIGEDRARNACRTQISNQALESSKVRSATTNFGQKQILVYVDIGTVRHLAGRRNRVSRPPR
jgi:hypothetical protein